MDATAWLIVVAIVAVVAYFILRSGGSGAPSRSASPPTREFYTKVAGVSRNNVDGSSRQRIIADCNVGEAVELRRDPDNPHDFNAVAVLRRRTGEQLGFLPRETAADVARKMAKGERFSGEISDLTGGTRGKPTRGVNLLIAVYETDRP